MEYKVKTMDNLKEVYEMKGLRAFHLQNDLKDMFNKFYELSEEHKEYFIEVLGLSMKTDNSELSKENKIELMMLEMNEKIEQLSNNKKLSSEDIKVINEKEYINVKEFEILFNRGKEAQKKYRGRVNNPLPTFSKGGKGVDTIYIRVDAEKWCNRYL